ncbi:MAG: hypothetical protein U5L02_20265 [Rheinheimera sp.]|nr:hypothetical protein [Rheinheimera sp.]
MDFFHDLQQWRNWTLCKASFGPLLQATNLRQLAVDYGIELPAQIGQSVPKRQAEYLAARLLLRQLQQQLGLRPAQIQLQLTQDWSAGWCAGSEIWLEYQTDAYGVQVLTEVSSRTTAAGEHV